MTERMPNIGESNWHNILGANDGSNGFLRVAHNDDGTLKITTGTAISDPSDISNLTAWYDANQITGYSDGQSISVWNDQSGSGYNATQSASVNKPTYKTNIQNGLPVVRFATATTAQYLGLSGTGLNLFRNISAVTVAAVASVSGVFAGGSVLYASKNDGTYGRFELANNFAVDPADSGVIKSAGSLYDTTGYSMLIGVADTGGTKLINWDTANMIACDTAFEAEVMAAQTNFANTASGFITIGGIDAGHFLNGDICEILVYQRALQLTERRQVAEYLASKWAVL